MGSVTRFAGALAILAVAACRSADPTTTTVTADPSAAAASGAAGTDGSPSNDAGAEIADAELAQLFGRLASGRLPSYPPAAQRLGEEGTVEIAIDLRTDGEVVAVAVSRSSGSPRLDAAALDAARTWRFHPRTGERSVERLRHRVVFRLDER